MSECEQQPSLRDSEGASDSVTAAPARPLDLDVLTLAAALHSPAAERLDWYLGRGVVFPLGDHRASLEFYSHVVRVTVPEGQLTVPRRPAEVAAEGVVFHDPDRFFLSVGPTGEVLFQSWPTAPTTEAGQDRRTASLPRPVSPPRDWEPVAAPRREARPSAETTEKAKSERYVGRMGEVRTHQTRRGKLVAEVELTVADPERPGASKLVKCVAFGDNAAALYQAYHPGQEVTAVGIPHELQRRGHDGRAWTERQLYLVQLPKPR